MNDSWSTTIDDGVAAADADADLCTVKESAAEDPAAPTESSAAKGAVDRCLSLVRNTCDQARSRAAASWQRCAETIAHVLP